MQPVLQPLLQGIAFELPMILVFSVGLMLTFTCWKALGAAAIPALVAMSVGILESLCSTPIRVFGLAMLQDNSPESIGTFFNCLAVFHMLHNVGLTILLLLAIFLGRPSLHTLSPAKSLQG